MRPTVLVAATLLLSTTAGAAELPWTISDDATFTKRTTLQLGAYGGIAAGIGISALSWRTSASGGFERVGLGLAGAFAIGAGLHLPTLTAYSRREIDQRFAHPLAVMGAAPMLLMGTSMVAWVVVDPSDGTEVFYAFGVIFGILGAAVTHVPALLGPILHRYEISSGVDTSLGLDLLPAAATGWGEPPTRSHTPVATLSVAW